MGKSELFYCGSHFSSDQGLFLVANSGITPGRSGTMWETDDWAWAGYVLSKHLTCYTIAQVPIIFKEYSDSKIRKLENY